MNTYTFVQKNTSATYTTSAKDEDEAWANIGEDMKSTAGWRLDETIPEDDDDEEKNPAEDDS